MAVKQSSTTHGKAPSGNDPGDAGARGDKQKRRTRAALLAAAARLIAQGQSPSVGEVADEADVSRRTAYRYFPTQEQLLAEASLEAVRPHVEAAMAAALPEGSSPLEDIGQARARLDAAVTVIQRLAIPNEALLRTMIRLTAGRTGEGRPVRGYRRVEWITSAVLPVKARLGRLRFERLVSALTACVGMDALFLLQDTRGLSPSAAERVTRWTARALLDASIRETEEEE